jgi:hypothetical protein
MPPLQAVPPARMTPEQRRDEVASLLARGLLRLRGLALGRPREGRGESEFELGFPRHQRLHSDPSLTQDPEDP